MTIERLAEMECDRCERTEQQYAREHPEGYRGDEEYFSIAAWGGVRREGVECIYCPHCILSRLTKMEDLNVSGEELLAAGVQRIVDDEKGLL